MTTRTLLLGATMLAGAPALAQAQAPVQLATGQFITPTAAPGATFQALNPGLPDHPTYGAGEAIKTAISPDGTTLLVLTSGYNNLSYSSGSSLGAFEPSASQEYVFVYDITGAHASQPFLKQVVQIPDTFLGLTFSPDGTKFYVSGGVDDVIYTYSDGATGWTQTASVSLGHHPDPNNPVDAGGIGFFQSPSVANLALSASGATLVAVNIHNDSISVVDTASNTVKYEYDLRPFNTTPSTGQGVAGGETPIGVAVVGESTVYVSSVRDREVVVLNIAGTTPTLVTRIPMSGNPNSMVLDNPAHPTRLYVAQDNSDYVAVINLADNTIVEQIDVIAPPGTTPAAERYTGAAPNAPASPPDRTSLFVTNGGQNAVSVVSLRGPIPHSSAGLIPTGWYPHSVSLSNDGRYAYVVNGKSNPGPNLDNLSSSTYALIGTHYKGGNQAAENQAYASNQYAFQIEPAGLLTVPVADATNAATLATLTSQVATNNLYNVAESPTAAATMSALQAKIKHIIYIIKENRTFDQVLGDLTNGANVDPTLTVFGKQVTPNFHKAAEGFVTLDNFYDPAEVSGNGWQWSTAAREADLNVKYIPLDYASSPAPSALNQGGRGMPYDAEGQNNNVDVGIPTIAGRSTAEPTYPLVTAPFPGGTANFFPGTNDDAATDGPNGQAQMGYIWDSALHAGLTVRNYGFYIDLGGTYANVQHPYALGDVEAYSTNPELLPLTDSYFRGFDNNYPDHWRFEEWRREFNSFEKNGDLPQLSFVRFMHDHMGSFSTAVGGINVPEKQQADNDYAVGELLDAVAHSPDAGDTLVFVVEDDPQDGPDHVDDHRSTGYIVGPYVKHKAVVSTHYTTVNMLRTMEDILGIDHLNLNDAYAAPMADVFDLNQKAWTFNAVASPYLQGTVDALNPGIHFADNAPAVPTHDAAWWSDHTKGFDWSKEDRVPADLFNRVLWEGLKGTPFTTGREPVAGKTAIDD